MQLNSVRNKLHFFDIYDINAFKKNGKTQNGIT